MKRMRNSRLGFTVFGEIEHRKKRNCLHQKAGSKANKEIFPSSPTEST